VSTATDVPTGRAAPWIVIAATVVVGAVLQAASAVPGLGTASTPWFAVQAVGSFVVLVAELCLLAWAAGAVARRARLGRLPVTLVMWAAAAVLVVIAVAVVLPLAVPLALVVPLCVLPAAAAGQRAAWRGFRVFGRSPVRAVVATIVVVAVAALTWVVALVSGFFLTGALGGLVMWLWFGAAAALLLVWWTRLSIRRPHTAPAPEPATAE
jgi:hypothetical protein